MSYQLSYLIKNCLAKKNVAYTSILFLFMVVSVCVFNACSGEPSVETLPKVWTRYAPVLGYEEDFKDLVAKGVDAIEYRGKPTGELLAALRKYGLRVSIGVSDITQKAWLIDQDEVERTVMIGGAYQGKAIDRFRFSFSAEPQAIIIESPVYSKNEMYKPGLGRYFEGMHDPLRGEVIVCTAPYDGRQHVKILPATLTPINRYHWEMRFDLTGVEGDLDNVILAVYWISEGSRAHWILGDGAAANAESTKKALKKLVEEVIEPWKKANGGSFPTDLVFALRFGDECFHLTGHLNAPECSYPLWDYSQTSIDLFKEHYPEKEYPRGKAWNDVFGRDSYAGWMYLHHKSCASLAEVVRAKLAEEGLEKIKIFRNFTRFNVFHEGNDHDGTGLELLVKHFDFVHIDPYPVTTRGYNESVIPSDMEYVSGLARRYKKPVIPWLQAHIYGGLLHPEEEDINKMVNQHRSCGVDGIKWLGYGPKDFNTFPLNDSAAWEAAGQNHELFKNSSKVSRTPALAIIRPYTVRALRDRDRRNLADVFLTDNIIDHITRYKGEAYDVFEPIDLSIIEPEQLLPYPIVIATAGKLDKLSLNNLRRSGKLCVVLICESDHYTIDSHLTGILSEKGIIKISGKNEQLIIPELDPIPVERARIFLLDDNVHVLGTIEGHPVIWRKDNLVFISVIPVLSDNLLVNWLLNLS